MLFRSENRHDPSRVDDDGGLIIFSHPETHLHVRTYFYFTYSPYLLDLVARTISNKSHCFVQPCLLFSIRSTMFPKQELTRCWISKNFPSTLSRKYITYGAQSCRYSSSCYCMVSLVFNTPTFWILLLPCRPWPRPSRSHRQRRQVPPSILPHDWNLGVVVHAFSCTVPCVGSCAVDGNGGRMATKRSLLLLLWWWCCSYYCAAVIVRLLLFLATTPSYSIIE